MYWVWWYKSYYHYPPGHNCDPSFRGGGGGGNKLWAITKWSSDSYHHRNVYLFFLFDFQTKFKIRPGSLTDKDIFFGWACDQGCMKIWSRPLLPCESVNNISNITDYHEPWCMWTLSQEIYPTQLRIHFQKKSYTFIRFIFAIQCA